MQLEQGLYSYLSVYAGLVALISDRIYPQIIPQGTTRQSGTVYPVVVMSRISTTRLHTMRLDSGYVTATMQFACYGQTYNSAISVANQVRLAIQNFNGFMDEVQVNAVLIENEISGYENKSELHYILLDFFITYYEDSIMNTTTQVYDPPELMSGQQDETTVTLTGASLGDIINVSFSLDTQGIQVDGRVTSTDTITVTFWNTTDQTIDVGSGVIRVVRS